LPRDALEASLLDRRAEGCLVLVAARRVARRTRQLHRVTSRGEAHGRRKKKHRNSLERATGMFTSKSHVLCPTSCELGAGGGANRKIAGSNPFLRISGNLVADASTPPALPRPLSLGGRRARGGDADHEHFVRRNHSGVLPISGTREKLLSAAVLCSPFATQRGGAAPGLSTRLISARALGTSGQKYTQFR